MAQGTSEIKYLTPIAVDTKRKNTAGSRKTESNISTIKMPISC